MHYRLYYDIFNKKYGPASGSVQLDDVEHHSDEDNQSAVNGTINIPTTDSKILNRFEKAVSKISDMYKYDPVRLGPALEAFCKQVENISTASAMRSALHYLGKYVRPGKRSSLKIIGLQPTAIARRKAALGCRKRTCLGQTQKATINE